jgi:hypothetical protein
VQFQSHSYAELYRLMSLNFPLNESVWSSRRDFLFWRGAAVFSAARVSASNILRNVSHADVKILEESHCVSLKDHCDNKYLVYIAGNTYSSR